MGHNGASITTYRLDNSVQTMVMYESGYGGGGQIEIGRGKEGVNHGTSGKKLFHRRCNYDREVGSLVSPTSTKGLQPFPV